MILGILLICNVEAQCVPVPNPETLFESLEECQAAATQAAESVPQEYTVDIYCYRVNYSVST